MADIRINALATTAASTASDDFVAVDGSANGTRKLNAFSPTFGGNLTVIGTSNRLTTMAEAYSGSGDAYFQVNRDDAIKSRWRFATSGANFELQDNYNVRIPLSIVGNTMATTIGGNLTVSGTGTSSVAGNLGIGTSNVDDRLKVSGTNANIRIENNTAYNASPVAYLGFTGKFNSGGDYAWQARIYGGKENATDGNSAGYMAFQTQTDSVGITEKVRITSTGNLLIGGVIDSGNGNLQLKSTSGTAAGGIGFGTTLSLHRQDADSLALASSGTASLFKFYEGTTTLKGVIGTSAGVMYLDSSTAASIILRTNSTTALTLDSSQNATFAGNITTAAPSGGTAGAWKLGVRVAATTTLDTTQYLQVDIGGTLYKVALVTS